MFKNKVYVPWKEVLIYFSLDKAVRGLDYLAHWAVEQATTTLEIEDTHPGYTHVLAALAKLNENNPLLRSLHVINFYQHDHEHFWPSMERPEFRTALGFGKTFFMLGNRPACVERMLTMTVDDIGSRGECLVITVLGRDKNALLKLLRESCNLNLTKVDANGVVQASTLEDLPVGTVIGDGSTLPAGTKTVRKPTGKPTSKLPSVNRPIRSKPPNKL